VWHVAGTPPQHGVIKSAADGILLGGSMFFVEKKIHKVLIIVMV